MNQQLKRLTTGTLVYGLGSMLNKLLSFLLLPLFTRYLLPEEYGISGMISFLLIALSGFFSLGVGNALGVIYFGNKDPSSRASVIWTAVLLLGANSLLLCGLGWLFSERLCYLLFQTGGYERFIVLALGTMAMQTLIDPLYAYFRMEEMRRTVVLLTVLETAVGLLLSISLVVYMKRGIAGVYEAGILARFLLLFPILALAWHHIPFKLDKAHVWPMLRIGFPSIFGIGAFFVIDYSDRAFVQRLTSTAEVGIYSVGYSLGMSIMLAVGAFGTAWPPFFASFMDKREEARELFGRVLKYYLLAFGALSLVYFAAAKPIVFLMTAPAFHTAYTVIGWVALAYMFKGCYLILLPGIYFEKKLYLQAIVEWISALACLGLNVLLIPRWGMRGAAWATCLGYLCLPVCAYVLGRKFLAVHYDWRRISLLVAGLILSATGLLLLSEMPFHTTQALGSLLLLFAFGGFALTVVLSKSEREQALLVMRRKMGESQ